MFLEYDRPGTPNDDTVLSELIQRQLNAYQNQPAGSLPNGFILSMAGVRFSMLLQAPGPDQQWMSMPLAIGALEIFSTCVHRWGSTETRFVASSGTQIVGRWRVEFF